MANKKISDLTSAGAITGTEELPIVQSSTTVKTTLNDVSTWLDTVYDFFGFVRKGTLTTNYIQKATGTDTIGNSNITDDGTTVTVGANLESTGFYVDVIGHYSDANISENYVSGGFDTKRNVAINSNAALISGTKNIINAEDKIELRHDIIDLNATTINAPQLTASQIVETDASKNLVSAAKGTAYNKNFGTGTTNVVEIGSTLGNTKPLITSSAGKLQTSNWTNIVSSCTFVGWSSYTTQEVDVIDMGAYYMLHINVSGTSNSTTTTIQLPYTSLSTNNGAGLFANNGTTIIGRWIFNSGSNTITFGVSATSAVWTASGTKSVGIDIFFKK